MSDLTIEVNTKKLEKAIRFFPRELRVQTKDAMDHIGRKFLKVFRQKRLQGDPGIKGRPGGIFRQFKKSVRDVYELNKIGLEISTTSKVALQHEVGAILHGKGGGKLAVPLSARTEMFTKSGRLRKRYRSPKDLKNVVPITFKKGRETYLAKVNKRSNEVRPLYVLKRRVKIKPRLGFFKTWDELNNERIKIINRSIDRTLESV